MTAWSKGLMQTMIALGHALIMTKKSTSLDDIFHGRLTESWSKCLMQSMIAVSYALIMCPLNMGFGIDWSLTWDPFHKGFTSSLSESHKKSHCFFSNNNDSTRSQLCICHDSSAVVTCANLWPHWNTSNGSWCIGIKGEMSGTVCVTFTWDIYIYMSCL